MIKVQKDLFLLSEYESLKRFRENDILLKKSVISFNILEKKKYLYFKTAIRLFNAQKWIIPLSELSNDMLYIPVNQEAAKLQDF